MSFTIRELESLSGIKAHTIRIWEQRYHFLKPSRTLTNIRTYSNEELKTLLSVALLNKYGFKISRIDQMDPELREKAILQLRDEDARHEHLVNEMIGYMIDLNSMEFESLLGKHIAQYGIDRTITEIIFYFLEKVGILWQTNRILPVQEHIVSSIIRQKIVSAIDHLPFVSGTENNFLLFLPEDEHHEMGLLFVYYLLRKKGIPVIYLGANVPLKDVEYLLKIRSISNIYLHLTSYPKMHNFSKFLSALSSYSANSSVLISGSVAQSYHKTLPSNIRLLKNFSEVNSLIEAF
jgi:DNA-binding transcriptional MerR regulator